MKKHTDATRRPVDKGWWPVGGCGDLLGVPFFNVWIFMAGDSGYHYITTIIPLNPMNIINNLVGGLEHGFYFP